MEITVIGKKILPHTNRIETKTASLVWLISFDHKEIKDRLWFRVLAFNTFYFDITTNYEKSILWKLLMFTFLPLVAEEQVSSLYRSPE